MNEPDQPEITELTALDVQKLSAVEGPANGTPFLLLKSIDLTRPPVTPTATHHKEKHVKTKGAKQLLKAQKRQERVRKAAAAAVSTYATDRVLRVNALKRALKSSPNNPAFAYQLSRELLKQGREDDLRAKRGLPPLDQASAIREASATGVANATGSPLNPGGPHDPRAALLSVRDDSYVRQSLSGQTALPSLVDLHKLEKQLRQARTPEERERLGFQVTRMALKRGHLLGEI